VDSGVRSASVAALPRAARFRRWLDDARVRTIALFLVSAVVLFAGTGSASVFDRDEARFALAVREMSARGDWLLPTNWGEPRYHKPILAYGCALASERVFGANAFAWRLPSVLAGLATLAMTVALARRHFGVEVALRAGALLASALAFVVEAKILTADALLLASTTCACWAWFGLVESGEGTKSARGNRARLLFWIAVALGILAKGVNVVFLAALAAALSFLRLAPEARRARRLVLGTLAVASLLAALPRVGFLGPVLCALVALALLFRRVPAPRVALGAVWGVPLCIALVATWLVPALVRSHGAFLSEGLGHHMLARSASPFEGHAGFPGYYLLAALAAFFPWALHLSAALRGAWRDPRCAFLLAWVLGPWAVLECMASKLPHYLLVTLPAAAVLVALHGPRRPLARTLGFATGLYLVLGFVVLPLYEPTRLAPRVGAEVARRAMPGETIHLVGYRPASLGCALPAEHRVVQDSAEIARALAEGAPGLFVVAAEDEAELGTGGSGAWEPLARISGREGFTLGEVALWRRTRAP
jgi:4-amino-4-deoxy-L-arabinose transferase-like glycosyltransferase